MQTVYISDLDGTLLSNDATLSPYSKTGLQRLLQQNLLFTVASARSVVAMQNMFEDILLPLPIIEFNGAFISDLHTGQHEIINSLEPVIAEEIYRHILDHHHLPFISTFNGSEDCLYYYETRNAGMRWYLEDRQQRCDKRLRHTQRLQHALRDEVVCFTIIGDAASISSLKASIQEHYGDSVFLHFQENPYSPGWYWFTIQDRKATKAQAIQTLLQQKQLDKYELVVFGDQGNDLPMFQIAHRRIAVANAINELKRHATYIIESNEQDGVVKFLEQDWERRQTF